MVLCVKCVYLISDVWWFTGLNLRRRSNVSTQGRVVWVDAASCFLLRGSFSQWHRLHLSWHVDAAVQYIFNWSFYLNNLLIWQFDQIMSRERHLLPSFCFQPSIIPFLPLFIIYPSSLFSLFPSLPPSSIPLFSLSLPPSFPSSLPFIPFTRFLSLLYTLSLFVSHLPASSLH